MRIRHIFTGLLLSCFCAVLVQAQAPTDKAWNILKQGAADKNVDKRVKALRALALVTQNQTAQQMAENALADEKPEVRSAAASALGLMGAKSSIPKLKQVGKEEKDAGVVFSITDALFRMGDPAAFQVYYAVLLGEKKTGEGLVDSQVKMLKDPKAILLRCHKSPRERTDGIKGCCGVFLHLLYDNSQNGREAVKRVAYHFSGMGGIK